MWRRSDRCPPSAWPRSRCGAGRTAEAPSGSHRTATARRWRHSRTLSARHRRGRARPARGARRGWREGGASRPSGWPGSGPRRPPRQEHVGARLQLAGGAGTPGCLDRGDALGELLPVEAVESDVAKGAPQLAAQQRHDLAALDHLPAREMRCRSAPGRRRGAPDRARVRLRSPAGSRPVAISPMRRRISRRASPSGILPASRVRRRCEEPRPPRR